MSTTVSEDKRAITNTETKARELDAKIKALLGLEKDIRSCIEQLQIVEKEMKALDSAQKDYAEIKDLVDSKTVEKSELLLKIEVGYFVLLQILPSYDNFISASGEAAC